MPVIRWIMNHTVIVFVGVLVAAGLFYQDEIKTELTQMGVLGASASQTAEAKTDATAKPAPAAAIAAAPAVSAAQADAAAAKPSQMPTQLTPSAPVEAAGEAAAPAEAPATQTAQPQQGNMAPYGYAPPQGMPYNTAMMQPQGYPQQRYGQPNFQQQMPPQMQQQMQQQQERMQQQQQRMQQMQQMRPQMPTPPVNPMDAGLDDALKDKWVAARTAYWAGDKEKAEELYKAIVEESKEADVAGELGNMYFSERRYDDAAAMYYEAGLRYLDSDTPMQAGMVMGVLSQIAPQKAGELREKLMEKHNKLMEERAAAFAAEQAARNPAPQAAPQAPAAPAN